MTMSAAIMDHLAERGLDVELLDRLGLASANRGGGEMTPATLRALLDYDPATGGLTWLPRPPEMFPDARSAKVWNTRYAGKPALTAVNSYGYRKGHVLATQFVAHRVAWAIKTGRWPTDMLDHINGDKVDNRWANLREADANTNARNLARSRANTSGATGVARAPKGSKWVAYIRADGRRRHLGYFDSIDQAVAARKAAEKRLGYHANHGRSA